MASRAQVTVVVYDSRIQAMNAPGGDVHRYVDRKTAATVLHARAFAPKRTGRLAAGIRTDVRMVRNGTVGRVRTTAKYSIYVHEGTTGPIFPDGEFLWVPARKYGTKRIKMPFVSGQRGNPFLTKALGVAMSGVNFLDRPRMLSGNPFG